MSILIEIENIYFFLFTVEVIVAYDEHSSNYTIRKLTDAYNANDLKASCKIKQIFNH